MGWNGSGVFNRLFNWTQDKSNGINITASRFDSELNDYVNNGFGNTLTRDGQGVPTANLPMNGFKHTGAAAATASGQYLLYGQTAANVATFVGVGTYGIRDTSAAFDVQLGATSSVTLTAARALTIDVANAARTLKLTGNAVLNQDVSTAGSPTFGGGITIPNSAGLGDGVTAPYMFTANHQAQISGANTNNYSLNVQNTASSGSSPNVMEISTPNVASNNSTAWFLHLDDSGAERGAWLSNGGIANFSANNTNLSDARVKPSFERYTDEQIDALSEAFCAVDWGRFKYEDQTHDDWNHGYTAQGVQKAFAGSAPELVDDWIDGKLLAVYNEDLKNIGNALLARLLRDVAEIKRRLK